MNRITFFACFVFVACTQIHGLPFTKNHPLIIGGEDADPGEFPFQVLLLRRDAPLCGGVILRPNLILTAAHCAVFNLDDYKVVAGEHDRRVGEGNEQIRNVEGIYRHQDYDDFTFENDIAVMYLTQEFEFNEFVGPVTLPPSNYEASGHGLVSGWGVTQEGGSSAYVLQKVSLPLVSRESCRDAYGEDEVKDGMICAGYAEGGKDSCQGDSGGPLLVNDGDDVQYIAGIVSWGFGCAQPGYPGVYTDVAHYRTWIDERI